MIGAFEIPQPIVYETFKYYLSINSRNVNLSGALYDLACYKNRLVEIVID